MTTRDRLTRRRSRGRARTLRSLCVWGGLSASLAGCGSEQQNPAGIEFQDLSGRWSYIATLAQRSGMSCEIRDLVLEFSQIPGTGSFRGSTTGGTMACRDALTTVQVPLERYPIPEGYTFNEFFSFNVYTKEWRHEGIIITPDSLDGSFKLINNGMEFDGRFTAVRRR